MLFLRICILLMSCIVLLPCNGVETKKIESSKVVKKVSKPSPSYPPKKKVVSQKKSLVTKTIPQTQNKLKASTAPPSIKARQPNKTVSKPRTQVSKAQVSKTQVVGVSVPKTAISTPSAPVSVSPSSQVPVTSSPVSTTSTPALSTPSLSVSAPSKTVSKTQLPKGPTPTPSAKQIQPPTMVDFSKIPSAKELSAIKDQKLIVIDAGHGGYDLGARMSACDEKSLALSTALITKKYLTEMGYRVILTRSRDFFMPLEKRTAIANETKSKLFVSIHFNAAKNPVAKGIEVFYYASADKFRTGSSKKLAARVLSKVIDRTVAESRGIKEGNFYVIRETHMPAILIEAGFMTHPEELHLLRDINYRDKIARGIAEGIDSYFKL